MIKLLEVTEVFSNKDDLSKLCTVVNSARLVDLLLQTQAIDMKLYNQKLRDSEKGREFAQTVTEIIEDPRNPFRKHFCPPCRGWHTDNYMESSCHRRPQGTGAYKSL